MASIKPRTSPRRLGPRTMSLKDKEKLELGKLNYSYQDFKNGTPAAKVKIIEARPDIALGKAAGRDFEDVQYRIYFIILAAIIVASLTTVSYTTIKGEHRLREYLVAALSISWFIVVSFVFLLFDATRLMHIIFFAVVLALVNVVYHDLDKEEPAENKETQNIITAVSVFSGSAVIILLYYYLTSRKEDEIMELKTREKLRERNEEITKLVKEAKLEGQEDLKRQLDDYKEREKKISTTAIDKFLISRIQTTKKEADGKKADGNKADGNKSASSS